MITASEILKLADIVGAASKRCHQTNQSGIVHDIDMAHYSLLEAAKLAAFCEAMASHRAAPNEPVAEEPKR